MRIHRILLLAAITTGAAANNRPVTCAEQIGFESFGLIELESFFDLIFDEPVQLDSDQPVSSAMGDADGINRAIAFSPSEVPTLIELCDHRSDCTRCDAVVACDFDCAPSRSCSVAALFGYESFRGHPDGGWANYGLHTGLNVGTRLGKFSE